MKKSAMPILVVIKLNGIQEYIFQSNLLKENIGASHITNDVLFEKHLKYFLENMFKEPGELAWSNWEKTPEILQTATGNCNCELVEIGGGGVLLLFKDPGKVPEFIKGFSFEILFNFPGLKTSFACNEYKETDIKADETPTENVQIHFQKIKKGIIQQLETHNKSGLLNTIPHKLGIMQNCQLSNYAAEFDWKKTEKDAKILKISGSSKAKVDMVDAANQYYRGLIANDKFTMTTELDKLGQNPESGYIAVVHIDGNGIGKKVSALKGIKDLRKFSVKRAALIEYAIKTLITENIIDKVDKVTGIIAGIQLNEEVTNENNQKIKRWILPIRPLLHGGDDITFVCEGRLGIYLAEAFLKFFTTDPDIMDAACAGVAIVKTKFPFYKAYSMAEELCNEAKEKSRGTNISYLSYFYSASTFSGKLSQIRKRTHQTTDDKNLYFGPYAIATSVDSIERLKDGIRHFMNKDKISKNKVMKLREILNEGNANTELFAKELLQQDFSLPDNKSSLWTSEKKNQTPFFDQIELMDFYPIELL